MSQSETSIRTKLVFNLNVRWKKKSYYFIKNKVIQIVLH